jgi:hypothetical protein
MSYLAHSVAMAQSVHAAARGHLLRADGQEDLCFALWRPSAGAERFSGLIQRLTLPEEGEREVHGNASFYPSYLDRAIEIARGAGAGLALMHSHPCGCGWQGMSRDDIETEQGRAAAVWAATGFPLLGLTIAGDESWSARFWKRTAPRTYERFDCGAVRVLGERLAVTFFDHLMPPPIATDEQVRTISAWGEALQQDLARLRVCVVGAGSVGGFVAEALARIGIKNITIVDFDKIEARNLDRLNYATRVDIGLFKAPKLADYLRERATADGFEAKAVEAAVYEEKGFRAALDCDVIFSCVDRPWGRQVLNLIAYAHLIPVVDGGVAVGVNRSQKLVRADWRAHTAMPGRRCLESLKQYDPGDVQLERDGRLDDPSYIEGLDADHPLRAGQNVFAFSMACASLQVLQMLSLVVAPPGQSNPGAQLYHFVGGYMEDADRKPCEPTCLFPGITAKGDHCEFNVTGVRCMPA